MCGGELEAIKTAAKELVALKPDVIVAGATAPVLAVRAATATIPIVVGGDPEKLGLAQTLAHPGGNVTSNLFYALTASGKTAATVKAPVNSPAPQTVGVGDCSLRMHSPPPYLLRCPRT